MASGFRYEIPNDWHKKFVVVKAVKLFIVVVIVHHNNEQFNNLYHNNLLCQSFGTSYLKPLAIR